MSNAAPEPTVSIRNPRSQGTGEAGLSKVLLSSLRRTPRVGPPALPASSTVRSSGFIWMLGYAVSGCAEGAAGPEAACFVVVLFLNSSSGVSVSVSGAPFSALTKLT